jgi:hypothetical protein
MVTDEHREAVLARARAAVAKVDADIAARPKPFDHDKWIERQPCEHDGPETWKAWLAQLPN